jgi:uncharacterized protein YjbI with pentapeptide repeats
MLHNSGCREEEQHMRTETGPSPARPEELSRRVPSWLVVFAAFLGAVVGVIVVRLVLVGFVGKFGFAGKTLWNYLDVFLVPVFVAAATIWLTVWESRRQRKDLEAQEGRALAVENQRAQDDALQAYLDQMSQLLADKDRPLHKSQPGDSLSTIARARTLTILPRLDDYRIRSILQFLHESGLIHKERPVVRLGGVNLSQIDLSEANLRGADLCGVNLSGANLDKIDLNEANLREANLTGASLSRSNLSNARLGQANLENADIHSSNLRGADLSDAKMRRADLDHANLSDANLSDADLWLAKLSYATLTNVVARGAHISEANGENANLVGADLSNAYLGKINLTEADLSSADLSGAQLFDAILRGANFTNAELDGAELRGAKLDSFEEASGWYEYWGDGADLSKARGLTKEQLEQTEWDWVTKFPDYLKHPGARSKRANEESNEWQREMLHENIQRTPVPQVEHEQRILTQIGEDPRTMDMRRVNVEVNDAIVELRGEAPSEEARAAAGEIASRVEGVREVRNLITVR